MNVFIYITNYIRAPEIHKLAYENYKFYYLIEMLLTVHFNIFTHT